MASINKRIKLEEASQALEIKRAVDDDVQPDLKRKSPQLKAKIKKEEGADILSLNDDCFDAIFQRMTLDDLSEMSKTCTRIQELCVNYFRRRYKEKVLIIDGVTANGKPIYRPNDEQYVVAFAKNNRNVTFTQNCASKATLRQLNTYYAAPDVTPIKQLRFDNFCLRLSQGRFLANLVKDVESVTFSNTTIFGDLKDCVLHLMGNMKELTLAKASNVNIENTTWMLENYPKLQRFSWHVNNQELTIAKAKAFFAINPNINFFSLLTKSSALVEQLLDENIQVNELFFEFTALSNMASTFEILFALCETQHCRLHMKFKYSAQSALEKEYLDRLVSLATYIDGLYFENVIDSKLAKTLVTLNRLKVLQCKIDKNSSRLAKIPNLEEIYAYWGVNSADFDGYQHAMMTYARHSPKLRKIYLRNNSQPFDRFEFEFMDNGRLELQNACKLKIHIRTDEMDYMGALNDIERNYNMIEIVRVETEVVKNPLVDEYLISVPLDPKSNDRKRNRIRDRWYYY